MANVATAKIPPSCFPMTIFGAVSHPVSTVVGNWFLAAMAVDTITGIMAIGAQTPVMARFHPVTAVFPPKCMITRFLGPMAGFTEFLPIRMTINTGCIQTADLPMAALPILLMTCRCFFRINLLVTGRTLLRTFLLLMTFEAKRHLGTTTQTTIFGKPLMTGCTLKIGMNFMTENQISMTFRFRKLLNFIIIFSAIDSMTHQAVFRGIVLVNIMAFLAVIHCRSSIITFLPGNMALITSHLLLNNVETVTEFEPGFFPTTVHHQEKP